MNNWFATTFSCMLNKFAEKGLDYPQGFLNSSSEDLAEGCLQPHVIGSSVDEDDYQEYLAWKEAIKETAKQFADTKNDCGWSPSLKAQNSRDKAFEFIRKYYFDLWC